jgi:hypothetical protein
VGGRVHRDSRNNEVSILKSFKFSDLIAPSTFVPDGAGLESLESCARLSLIRTSTFQSFPSEKGKSSVHLALDNHTAAKAVLDQQSADY